ncbi:hypothetical protein [Anabaena catenula]|uniref:Uncharacterized protein n=1 Tax=Anabaena catenula FACHB-362 TaxID=2692877 RepID=A0ABR8J189_9NOST|nr:hypothetical protein [Anabaena catenula]MBD2691634.1 hypothetical protein [Anabaena catenula FACHB-362]
MSFLMGLTVVVFLVSLAVMGLVVAYSTSSNSSGRKNSGSGDYSSSSDAWFVGDGGSYDSGSSNDSSSCDSGGFDSGGSCD